MSSFDHLTFARDPRTPPHLDASPRISLTVLQNLCDLMRKNDVRSLSADELQEAINAYRSHQISSK